MSDPSSAPITSTPAAARPSQTPAAKQGGAWHHRLMAPVLKLLTQGLAPDQIAACLAVGSVCSLFPIFGTTSLLNLAAGVSLRLNLPLMQALNAALTPVHVVMIILYVRVGEFVSGAHADHVTAREMLRIFHQRGIGPFFDRFGLAILHACVGWAITAPLLFVVVYYGLRPMLRSISRKIHLRHHHTKA